MTSPASEGQGRRIVVGVDVSPSSLAALRWALRQAELTGAAVEPVMAWQGPTTLGWALDDEVDFEARTRQMLGDAVAKETAGNGQVEVHPRVAEGNAARVLLDAARGAELLVVGSRGHGGFAGALLGSVSQHCVQHADCPVVVLRGAHPG
jgi:nucleotide-binding universal stress UspA family protein